MAPGMACVVLQPQRIHHYEILTLLKELKREAQGLVFPTLVWFLLNKASIYLSLTYHIEKNLKCIVCHVSSFAIPDPAPERSTTSHGSQQGDFCSVFMLTGAWSCFRGPPVSLPWDYKHSIGLSFLEQVLGVELRFLFLHGKHFTFLTNTLTLNLVRICFSLPSF